MAKKVVTFGEIDVETCTGRILSFCTGYIHGATYGGGEANVAVSLQTMVWMQALLQNFRHMRSDRLV